MSSPLGSAAEAAAETEAGGKADEHLFDESQLHVEDFVVIVVYFLSVLTVGIWVRERGLD